MIFDYRNEYSRYRRYYTYLEPVFRNPKARAYFSLILSLLSLSVFGFFAIRPTVSTIVALRKRIVDSRTVNLALQQKINALSFAQTDYYNYQADIPLAAAAIPSEADVSIFISQIEKLATEAAVLVDTIQIQSTPVIETSTSAKIAGPKTSKVKSLEQVLSPYQIPGKKMPVSSIYKPRSYNFSVSISGQYSSMIYFLEKLNYLDRLVTLERVSVVINREEKTGTVVPIMNINGYAFFLAK